MYQSLEATTLLLELMDFWLPDLKFWENDFAKKMSGVNNYREIVTRNIKMAYDIGSGEILIKVNRHYILQLVEELLKQNGKWQQTKQMSLISSGVQYHNKIRKEKKNDIFLIFVTLLFVFYYTRKRIS